MTSRVLITPKKYPAATPDQKYWHMKRHVSVCVSVATRGVAISSVPARCAKASISRFTGLLIKKCQLPVFGELHSTIHFAQQIPQSSSELAQRLACSECSELWQVAQTLFDAERLRHGQEWSDFTHPRLPEFRDQDANAADEIAPLPRARWGDIHAFLDQPDSGVGGDWTADGPKFPLGQRSGFLHLICLLRPGVEQRRSAS